MAKNTEEPLSLWSEEHLVSLSVSPDSEADWQTTVATWHSNIAAFLVRFVRGGLYGKTSPEFFRPGRVTHRVKMTPSFGTDTEPELTLQKQVISHASLKRFKNAGIVARGECWTLNISEFPSDVVGSSLSDILETGDIPQRFFLSPKACRGIVRRAKKRGKALPELLKVALENVATQNQATGTETD
jgi:hypothetical protein